jgi:hypothetical protein
VIEVRLHRDLYRAAAVDEAVKVYAPHATLERCDAAEHWGVRVTAPGPKKERRVAGELANYALGVTARERAAAGATK